MPHDPNLWLLHSLLHDADVQGEDHPCDQAGLGPRQLLHQGVHLLSTIALLPFDTLKNLLPDLLQMLLLKSDTLSNVTTDHVYDSHALCSP